MLLGRYQDDAFNAKKLHADALLDMLQHFDIYRRPERFEQFVAACEMRALAGTPGALLFEADYLHGAASAARAVPVKPLLEQGFKGAELGKALSAARLDALSIYCREYSQ